MRRYRRSMRRRRRSARRYRRGVFGDCGVGVTPKMCNRVTNHGDTGTFFRPALLPACHRHRCVNCHWCSQNLPPYPILYSLQFFFPPLSTPPKLLHSIPLASCSRLAKGIECSRCTTPSRNPIPSVLYVVDKR